MRMWGGEGAPSQASTSSCPYSWRRVTQRRDRLPYASWAASGELLVCSAVMEGARAAKADRERPRLRMPIRRRWLAVKMSLALLVGAAKGGAGPCHRLDWSLRIQMRVTADLRYRDLNYACAGRSAAATRRCLRGQLRQVFPQRQLLSRPELPYSAPVRSFRPCDLTMSGSSASVR